MLESTRPIGKADASGKSIADRVGLLIRLRGLRLEVQTAGLQIYVDFMLILVPSLNKLHEVFKETLRISDEQCFESFSKAFGLSEIRAKVLLF